MVSKTLLDKAKLAPGPKYKLGVKRRKEKLELAFAYARGEIGSRQVAQSMGLTNAGNGLNSIGVTLMSAMRRGEVGPIPKILKGIK